MSRADPYTRLRVYFQCINDRYEFTLIYDMDYITVVMKVI